MYKFIIQINLDIGFGSSVRRIFERAAGNLKIMKTKSKISPRRINPVFGSKLGELGEDQKKISLHSNLVRFLAQN